MILQAINFIIDCGSSVFMPLIIFVLSLVFRLKFGAAVKAGIKVGISLIGMNMVIELFTDSMMNVVNRLIDIYDFKLSVLDAGWATASSIAWSSGKIVPITLIAVFLTNILLLAIGIIKTLDVDIWNYWGAVFLASCIYVATGRILIAVLFACIAMGILFKCCDLGQPYIEKFYGLPGVTTCNFETMPWILLGVPMNKLMDKIPVIKDIDWSSESIEKKLGILGEPFISGLLIGAALALFAQNDAKTVLQTAMITSASLYLLPKMIDVLLEGFEPVSVAASEFMKKKFKGREFYIGISSPILVGHSSIIATGLLMIPTTLLLAVILPGNTVLPLAELSTLVFFFVWAVVPSNGNVFRGWVIGSVFMCIILWISSAYADAMTSLAINVGINLPEGTSTISCLTIGGEWISFALYKLAGLLFGTV